MTSLSRFSVRSVDPMLPPEVEVDGNPLSGVVEAHVVMSVGELPTLVVKIKGQPEDLVAHGAVYIQPEGPNVDFLELVDPDEIEAAALEKMEWGNGSIVKNAIDVLKERAHANQS